MPRSKDDVNISDKAQDEPSIQKKKTLSIEKSHQIMVNTLINQINVLQALKKRFKKTIEPTPPTTLTATTLDQPDKPPVISTTPVLSPSELHLKTKLGADYQENDLKANVTKLFDRTINTSFLEPEYIPSVINELVEFIEAEKAHPDCIYFYHGTNQAISFLYDIYTVLHQMLQINPEWSAFRASSEHFEGFQNIEQLISHYSKQGTTPINNYAKNFVELAISANVFLFGNCGVPTSYSIEYFLSNRISPNIGFNLRDALTHILKTTHLTSPAIDQLTTQFMALYSQYYEKNGGRLYQIGIPIDEVAQFTYPSVECGVLAPYEESLNLSVILKRLQEKQMTEGLSQSDINYLDNLQARILVQPTQKFVSQSIKLTKDTSETEQLQKDLQQLMQHILKSLLDNSTHFDKSSPLFRFYQEIFKLENSFPDQSAIFSLETFTKAILANNQNMIHAILAQNPSYKTTPLTYVSESNAKSQELISPLQMMVQHSQLSGQQINEHFGEDWIKDLTYHNLGELFRSLIKFPSQTRLNYLKKLTPTQVLSLMPPEENNQIIELLRIFPLEIRLNVMQYLWNELKETIVDYDQIQAILKTLPPDEQAQWIDLIGIPQIVKMITTKQNMLEILHNMPNDICYQCIQLLNMEQLRTLIDEEPLYLKSILLVVPPSDQIQFIDKIGLEWVKTRLNEELTHNEYCFPVEIFEHCFGESWVQKINISNVNNLISLLTQFLTSNQLTISVLEHLSFDAIQNSFESTNAPGWALTQILELFPANERLLCLQKIGLPAQMNSQEIIQWLKKSIDIFPASPEDQIKLLNFIQNYPFKKITILIYSTLQYLD